MKSCLLCLLLSIFFSCATDARGDLFTINVSGDGSLEDDGDLRPEDANGLIAGRAGSPFADRFVAILPFALPVIPVGHHIIDANLSFDAHRFGPQSGTPAADLYGLDFRTSSTILPTDFFSESNTDPSPNADKLQDNILDLSIPLTFSSFNTDLVGDAALATYLANQYTNGASPGDFAFLRFNVDAGQAGSVKLYRIGSTAGSLPAVLTVVTAVPEPSSFLFCTMACAIFGMRFTRRRRR